MSESAEAAQRIDRWLWCARFFKTRTLTTKFINSGNVRITRFGETTRVEKASAMIMPGDTIVFLRGERLKIIEVLSCTERRGPAAEARTLYADHSPPPPKKDAPPTTPFSREKGAGRPTKKDRRALETLKTSP